MKYGQLIIGPAGSGKSTYCRRISEYYEINNRLCKIINLDPAADELSYNYVKDIRDLISVEDVMSTLQYGPNGGLIYCMEYLVEHLSWLEEGLCEVFEEEVILFDCPGQIELYTHLEVMRCIVRCIEGMEFRLCAVCCLDVSFVQDASKLLSGSLCALSMMIQLELPHVNVLTKCDLIYDEGMNEEENEVILNELMDADVEEVAQSIDKSMPHKFKLLNAAFASVLNDYNLVAFLPLNLNDEDSMRHVTYVIDSNLQYGEEAEPNAKFDMSDNL